MAKQRHDVGEQKRRARLEAKKLAGKRAVDYRGRAERLVKQGKASAVILDWGGKATR